MFGVYSDNIEIIIKRNQTPKELREVCSFISKGITPKYTDNNSELIINQKCINNNRINYSFAKYHIPKNKNEKWLRYGDILVNSTGTGTLGRSAQYWGESNNITVDSHITIIRTANEFYSYYLGTLCQMMQPFFENMQTGSTAQTDLPKERLKAMIIGVPNEDLLVLFNNVAKAKTRMICEIEKEITTLEELIGILIAKIAS